MKLVNFLLLLLVVHFNNGETATFENAVYDVYSDWGRISYRIKREIPTIPNCAGDCNHITITTIPGENVNWIETK